MPRIPYRWEVVILLWFAYFLHSADKQIYAVVLPPLMSELGLSHYQAGLVNTLFTLVVALMAPFAGALGDRFPRYRLLFWSVAIWTAGTLFIGFTSSFLVLLITRSALTAGAESFYPPVSHAYLAELHTKTRGLAISIHQTAQSAGPVAAGFLAGWIAERANWRTSFVAFGLAGLVLSIVMAWRMKPQGQPALSTGEPLLTGFLHCFQIDGVRRIGFAFAAVLFVTIGYSTWAPTIFGKTYGLSLSQAGFQTGFWLSATAMLGALLGGSLSDWQVRCRRSRFDIQAAALLLGAPFLWLLGAASTLFWSSLALGMVGLLQGVYLGSLAVSLYDFVEPRYRSSAAAVVLLLANLLASPSSALLGWIGDRTSLNTAVSALSLSFVIAAAILFSARTLPTVPETT